MALPSRSKISFLFDIKKAANIDDLTLFYLCQKGISELVEAIPSLQDALQTTLLSESSVNFYRGTMTKDELVQVD